MHSITVPVSKSFSFHECMCYLGRSASECLHQTSEGRLRKLLKINGQLHLVEISSPKGTELSINFLLRKPSEEIENSVFTSVSNWFDLNAPLEEFYAFAEGDPMLSRIVKKYYGLRLIGIEDLFEALSWAVTGQQINLAFAYTLKKKLTETYGEKLEFQGNTYYLYPTAEEIAGLQPQDLTVMQFSRKKAEYITGIARSIVSGELRKEKLQAQTAEDALYSLQQLHGVGSWTANYVLMKCLRDPDAFPSGDAGLHNAISLQLNLARKPSATEIQNLSSSWKGHRAYAAFYLWRSLLDD